MISSSNPFFLAEIVVIFVVIGLQLYISYQLFHHIKELKNIFKPQLKISYAAIPNNENIGSIGLPVKNNIPRITIYETNKIIERIVKALNVYLKNNYGAAVNFSIIKDIIDREVDVKDEEISQSVPIPLYLGLAATMIGIIFGLFSMPELKGNDFSAGIDALIRGVKWAMGSSLLGLLCTTILSSFFYKKAKSCVLKEKNDQLSFLQAELLPELIRAEDCGISGLRTSLDHFSRQATQIVDNLNGAIVHTEKNLNLQSEIISRIDQMDVLKISRINMSTFQILERNMHYFEKFSEYLSEMESISRNLKEFANQTQDVRRIASTIDANLEQAKEVQSFLTKHFDKIENSGKLALQAVDDSDSHFRDAILRLQQEIEARTDTLNLMANKTEVRLQRTFDNVGTRLDETVKSYLDSLDNTLTKANPQLNQLNELPSIKELIKKNTEILSELLKKRPVIHTEPVKIPSSSERKNQTVEIREKEIPKKPEISQPQPTEKKMEKEAETKKEDIETPPEPKRKKVTLWDILLFRNK